MYLRNLGEIIHQNTPTIGTAFSFLLFYTSLLHDHSGPYSGSEVTKSIRVIFNKKLSIFGIRLMFMTSSISVTMSTNKDGDEARLGERFAHRFETEQAG